MMKPTKEELLKRAMKFIEENEPKPTTPLSKDQIAHHKAFIEDYKPFQPLPPIVDEMIQHYLGTIREKDNVLLKARQKESATRELALKNRIDANDATEEAKQKALEKLIMDYDLTALWDEADRKPSFQQFLVNGFKKENHSKLKHKIHRDKFKTLLQEVVLFKDGEVLLQVTTATTPTLKKYLEALAASKRQPWTLPPVRSALK